MKLLALETATEAFSVAVFADGALYAHHEVAPRRHGELLLTTVDRLLDEAVLTLADMDAIAFGRGPGAFTGVRIAISAAQGLAFGIDKPVVGVSTLAALAQSALDEGHERVLAAIDARMDEIYAGRFIADADGLAVAAGDEWLGPAGDFHDADGWHLVGTGTPNHALPTAAAVARIAAREFSAGHAIPVDEAQPTYLRDKVTG
jgi:tRNA threonylcarbamoyladenosine biosynthesis protein TsaB